MRSPCLPAHLSCEMRSRSLPMIRRWAFSLILASCTLACAGTMKGGGTAGAGGASATGGIDGSGGSPATSSGATASGGGSNSGGSITSRSLRQAAQHGRPRRAARWAARRLRSDWGASSLVRSGIFWPELTAPDCPFEQDGPSVEYTVVVDGTVRNKVVSPSGRMTTTAVAGLAAGEHLVEVYRRGEASFGTTTLYAVKVEESGFAAGPPSAKARHIEVVGDSITCGYGNEGADVSCPFSADTENHYMAYGAVLARTYEADVSTVAWSGKGIVKNYAGQEGPTLPALYERAIPDDEGSVWDFQGAPEPDLVVVNLGTNDYSTDDDPTDQAFVSGYGSLLALIRARYPETQILCTVGPLLSGADLDTARANIEAAVTARVTAGDLRVRAFRMTTANHDPGCDWHPSIATHTAMASELEPVVVELLAW